ncbi:MAG: non-canonical purine NTP pyrophosphatase [Halobacteriovoraceae bacterium]|nr:non-canonical purine NTP pyrophosphatase [Halobacteriovoraceae bacterium]|tara:strand:- start:21743 stop:22318 length:576 start_codon:yes stop_codon:yes gene_type:complete
MHEFILGSSNPHKADELNELLGGAAKIKPASEKLKVVEDADTFEGNAFKKAKAYHDFFKSPALADDSGLVVKALPNLLGVKSARFAPELPDYRDKNLKLIELMKDFKGEDRSAYFICNLCFYLSESEVYFFEGRVNGTIGHELKGDKGFGYDPIFVQDGLEGKHLAEVSEWKMKNSHRARACREAVKFFQN